MHALRERSRVIHLVRQLSVEPLKAHAGANGPLRRRFPRQHRIDVVGFDLGFDRLKTPEPVGVVFRFQSIRNIDADAERPLVGERHAEIQIGHACTAARIAARAAERLSERCLRAAIVKFGRWANQIRGHDELHRLQPHESGRIVEDRAHILGRCSAAGVGMSEPARVLFLQCKSGALRVFHGKPGERGSDCRRDRRNSQTLIDHPNVLLWFFDRLASRWTLGIVPFHYTPRIRDSC